MTTINCPCGRCDGPSVDVDSDEYLDTHFECEGCGSDFPMEDELVTERWTTYEDSVTVYFCKSCGKDDDTYPIEVQAEAEAQED